MHFIYLYSSWHVVLNSTSQVIRPPFNGLFLEENMQEFNDIKPLQLELPFTKSSLEDESYYHHLDFNISTNKDIDIWFDPFIPHASWDNRKLKKFIIEMWITDSDHRCMEIYATSEKVARAYAEKNFCFTDIYCVPIFPSESINDQISLQYKLHKSFEEQMNGQ